jgi:predicted Zn finger-like uncharacterized protein
MSLITRCPACGTMFKVVPDQLKISEGWVRCGHCAEVFDAAMHLQADTRAAKPAAEPEAAPTPAATLLRNPDPSVAEPVEEFDSSIHTESGESIAWEAPDSEQIDEVAEALAETPLDRPFELRREDIVDPDDLPSRTFTRPAPLDEEEPEIHDLGFVRQARRRAFWRAPAMRWLLALAFLVLAVLLAVQVGLHDRDRLATDPALRPWIARLCAATGCTIGPPRQIDAIAIDSSSFNMLRGDAYRLNVTLKNQARNEVAMPALELTLTDAQDQPVVRRILMPAELVPNNGAIRAGSEWTGSLALGVPSSAVAARIAGYRLLAFYP